MGENLPYYILHGARDWNGSAWTLIYEFKAYILVAILACSGRWQTARWAALSPSPSSP